MYSHLENKRKHWFICDNYISHWSWYFSPILFGRCLNEYIHIGEKLGHSALVADTLGIREKAEPASLSSIYVKWVVHAYVVDREIESVKNETAHKITLHAYVRRYYPYVLVRQARKKPKNKKISHGPAASSGRGRPIYLGISSIEKGNKRPSSSVFRAFCRACVFQPLVLKGLSLFIPAFLPMSNDTNKKRCSYVRTSRNTRVHLHP